MNHPSREQAEALLTWAGEQNPGLWINHCRAVARAAQIIANRCGLDAERAYASGLLHDIGYYANADGTGRVCHVYAGYNDYDRLIQLCDCIGSAEGICILERRLLDVALRHGFNAHTVEKWKAFFALKDYFDAKCGENIYGLFREEISEGIFT